MKEPQKPWIIHIITAVLAGLNLLVFTLFLTAMLIFQAIHMLFGPVPVYPVIVWGSALVCGVLVAILGGKRLHRYFSGFEMLGSYIWLTVMLFLTGQMLAISFPGS
jgi:hypothetical protein